MSLTGTIFQFSPSKLHNKDSIMWSILMSLFIFSSLIVFGTSFLAIPIVRHRVAFSTLSSRAYEAQSSTEREPAAIQYDNKYMEQKNFILLGKFISPATGNLTETANEYVNFCDESFNDFLNDRISRCESKSGKMALGRIRYEINTARQRKLVQADKVLRGILKAGGILEMETKLRHHLRNSDIDMAFMVILQLNIEDAASSDAHKAVEVMTRLAQIISDYQDALVSAPVRLMRLLVRTDDANLRKQMLHQKLIFAPPITKSLIAGQGMLKPPVRQSTSVNTVLQSWGNADVTVPELEDTIRDVLIQVI